MLGGPAYSRVDKSSATALSGNRRGRDARHRRPINDARHGERAVFLAPLDIRVRRASHGAPGTSVVAGGGGARTSGAIQRHSWGVGRGTLHSFFPTSHVYPISYDIRIGVAGPSPLPRPFPRPTPRPDPDLTPTSPRCARTLLEPRVAYTRASTALSLCGLLCVNRTC
ncbi:hypothetical protein B0H11DRAFT_800196 [Mycena galericulata]|nr:hypothetical protein B0H11DRAFT_800196 [Mycena galericulata]